MLALIPHPRLVRSRTPMRTRFLGGVVAPLLLTAAPAPPAQAFPASGKAAVLNLLRSIGGNSIVSGQHNKEPASAPGQYTQQVHDVTGQWPGLWGGDMMFN